MNAELVALAKIVKKETLKEAREGLAIGTHPIDCTVRIKGSIKVGEDGESDVRGTVDYKAAFTTAIDMLAEKCLIPNELVADVVGMILRKKAANTNNKAIPEIIEAEERDCTKVTGKKNKKGTVTTKLEFEVEPAKAEIVRTIASPVA